MSIFRLAILSLIALPSVGAADEAFAPTMPPVESYAGIWERSPFVVETVAVQANPGLAARFALGGTMLLAGVEHVLIVDRNAEPAKGRFLAAKGKPNPEGIEIVSLTTDPDPRKMSVVIRQAGQQATLPFDPNLLAAVNPVTPEAGAVPPPPTGIPRPPTGQPGVNVPAPGVVSPPGANPNATPPPAVRRIIRPSTINVP